MKKFILLINLFLLATIPNLQAQTKKLEIANPSNFQKIESDVKVADCRASLEVCGERALVALGLAGFGGPDSIKFNTEIFNFKNGVGIYLLTKTGFDDPVISGERTRVAFVKKGRNYKFVQAGIQYKCKNGEWKKACSPNENSSKREMTTREAVANADDFQFLRLPASVSGRDKAGAKCYDSLLECGAQRKDYFGIRIVKGASKSKFVEETFVSADKNTGKNTGIYLLTVTGFKDDSVLGERYRLEFEKTGNAWELVQGGKQYQCARGENAGQWTKELCP